MVSWLSPQGGVQLQYLSWTQGTVAGVETQAAEASMKQTLGDHGPSSCLQVCPIGSPTGGLYTTF